MSRYKKVVITEIHPDDAYYEFGDQFVNKVITVTSRIVPMFDGYSSFYWEEDDGDISYFYAVKFEYMEI